MLYRAIIVMVYFDEEFRFWLVLILPPAHFTASWFVFEKYVR